MKTDITRFAEKRLEMSKTETISDITRENEHELNDWLFLSLCNELCCGLFESKWEARHGSAIGLLRILKHQFHSAGKSQPVKKVTLSANDYDIQNQRWLEDCIVRCVCVMILERFGDFECVSRL